MKRRLLYFLLLFGVSAQLSAQQENLKKVRKQKRTTTSNVSDEKPAFIKKADEYYASYRYADAKKIYEELIFVYKLDVNKHIEVYRRAANAGIKSNDYWFAERVNQKLTKATDLSFDDLYSAFMLHLFLGQYEKLEDILSSELVSKASGPKKELLMAYKKEKPWETLMKDTLGTTIQYQSFNSGKGDFGPVFYSGGISFSSRRGNTGPPSTFDNGSYIDQYVYDEKTKQVKTLRSMKELHHDGASFYDKSEQTWYFSKNLKAQKKGKLTTTGIFILDEKTNKEVAFPYNDSSFFIAQPYFESSSKTLYFSSDMPGGYGGADLWKSTFEEGKWTNPVNLGTVINTIEDEMFPYMHENNFYFASSGHVGLGGLDIYQTELKGNAFTKAKNLAYPLNAFGDDFALILSEDGIHGYYSNNRSAYKFVDEIYAFELRNLEIDVLLSVLENLPEKKPISYMNVVLKDEQGNTIDTLITNYFGQIEFKAKKDRSYTFLLGDDNYENKEHRLSTFNITSSDTLKSEILLDPRKVLVTTIAKDSKTDETLANTAVVFRNKETDEKIEAVTNEKGEITMKLPRNQQYEIFSSKKGFIDKVDSLTTGIQPELNKIVKLEKIKAGTTFKIENVFYDFAKATLRPESKIELDKLAEFLLKNDNIKVELSSHTDSRGSDKANQKLSQARAQSCVDYLLTKGVKKDNIVAKGYGESKLVNKCKNNVPCTEDEHQANRRTEIKILSVAF